MHVYIYTYIHIYTPQSISNLCFTLLRNLRVFFVCTSCSIDLMRLVFPNSKLRFSSVGRIVAGSVMDKMGWNIIFHSQIQLCMPRMPFKGGNRAGELDVWPLEPKWHEARLLNQNYCHMSLSTNCLFMTSGCT